MHKLKEIFKVLRKDFKQFVPPLTVTIDQEHHFEVWSEYKDKKFFFGSIILHEEDIQIAFFKDMSREFEWTLFPGNLFKRMETTFECRITDLSTELHQNIQEAIEDLIDYFRMNHMMVAESEF